MPQSLHMLGTHIIFSTKERYPFLKDEYRPRSWAYMMGILDHLECHSIVVGGMADHVHIFCLLSKKHSSTEILEVVKKESSKWLKREFPSMKLFHWQDGYGLFGVSPSHFEVVRQYILGQAEHHKKVSFQEEYLKILKKCHVDYDEKYLWG